MIYEVLSESVRLGQSVVEENKLADGNAQLYNNYDHSVADFVRQLKYPPVADQVRPILIVFTVPERAFAQAERRIKDQTHGDAQKSYVLPLISVDRVDDAYDIKRSNRNHVRRIAWTADRKKFYGMKFPIPMRLTYQVTFWTKTLRDRNDLTTQFMFLFDPGPLTYLTVEHPFPMGTRIVFTQLTETRNLPPIESPDAQRVLRRVFTLIVNGWIIPPPLQTGVVERVTTYIERSDDLVTRDELLDTVVVTA